jgi:hypothetical protein
MRNDCYFYIDTSLPENEQKVAGVCTDCQRIKKFEPVWYWSGKRGYGDYDLCCSICKKPIYIRESNNDQANNEDSKKPDATSELGATTFADRSEL